MSYSASFLDDRKYGADDFNAIISSVANDGVVPMTFTSSDTYSINSMNTLRGKIVQGGGVIPGEESLRCSYANGKVTINTGKAIFKSGVLFAVTEAENIDVAEGYVYLCHDAIANTADIRTAEAVPPETESRFIIPLCYVTDGDITDKRTYATAKLKLPAAVDGTAKYTLTWTDAGQLTISDIRKLKKLLPFSGERINFLVLKAPIQKELYLITERDGAFYFCSSDVKGFEYAFSEVPITLHFASRGYLRILGFERGDMGQLFMNAETQYVSSPDKLNSLELVMYASVCGGN